MAPLHMASFTKRLAYFSDTLGNNVAFSGSSNETAGGLIDNFEVIDIFWSWDDQLGRVAEKIKHFEALWSDRSPGLEIIDFTEASGEILSLYRKAHCPQADPSECRQVLRTDSPRLPKEITLRPYQKKAKTQWFTNHGRGVLKMATGSGKTITALSIASQLAMERRLACAIIICPYRHLVTQWNRECQRFGMNPILAFQKKRDWFRRFSEGLTRADNHKCPHFFTAITTNATFCSDLFQSCLLNTPRHTLLIADEVHNLGAERTRRSLPMHNRFTIGPFGDTGTMV